LQNESFLRNGAKPIAHDYNNFLKSFARDQN